MNLSEQEATSSLDLLISASQLIEAKLNEAGYEQSHDWMFAIREVLYDLRRLNLILVNLDNTIDLNNAPALLGSFARAVLYEVIPHVQGHMEELEQSLTVGRTGNDITEKDDGGPED
ncbi:MAG TPA: hypothetical protein VEY08_05255 [Chloroflexia bacterium]|nr:hypothetical protein [Chloroflexia bacterium]